MKTQNDWLHQLRRCSTTDTLEKVAERLARRLKPPEITTFLLAADHRRAEIVMQQLYDKVPASVWKHVK